MLSSQSWLHLRATWEAFKKISLPGQLSRNSESMDLQWDPGAGISKNRLHGEAWVEGHPITLFCPLVSLLRIPSKSFLFVFSYFDVQWLPQTLFVPLPHPPGNIKEYTWWGIFPSGFTCLPGHILQVRSEVGCSTVSCLTQKNEHDTSQLGPPVLGHARLVAHSDARENREQKEDSRQTQDGGSDHQGSAGLHVAWKQERRQGGLGHRSPWILHPASQNSAPSACLPFVPLQDLKYVQRCPNAVTDEREAGGRRDWTRIPGFRPLIQASKMKGPRVQLHCYITL